MEKKKRRKLKYNTVRNINGFVFVIPWVMGFLLFFIVPLGKTIFYSFCKVGVKSTGGMDLSFIGLQNYIDLFATEVTTSSQTLIRLFADENINILLNAPLIVIFSLFLALLANIKFKGRGMVRVIFFLPIILGLDIFLELISISTGGDTVSSSGGIFSEGFATYFLLRYTSISRQVIFSLTSYVDNIFAVISQAGVQTLIYLAGLQSISPSMYEVAKIEGANTYEMFWKVTLPAITNITVFVAVYTMVDLFLSSPIAEEIYNFAFTKSKIGVGSALSVVYMMNVLFDLGLLMIILGRMVKKYEK